MCEESCKLKKPCHLSMERSRQALWVSNRVQEEGQCPKRRVTTKTTGSPRCPVPFTGIMGHGQSLGVSSGPKGSSSSSRTVWDCSLYKVNLQFPRRSEQMGTLCKERLARGQRVAPRSQAVSEVQATAEVPGVRI